MRWRALEGPGETVRRGGDILWQQPVAAAGGLLGRVLGDVAAICVGLVVAGPSAVGGCGSWTRAEAGVVAWAVGQGAWMEFPVQVELVARSRSLRRGHNAVIAEIFLGDGPTPAEASVVNGRLYPPS